MMIFSLKAFLLTEIKDIFVELNIYMDENEIFATIQYHVKRIKGFHFQWRKIKDKSSLSRRGCFADEIRVMSNVSHGISLFMLVYKKTRTETQGRQTSLIR